MTAPRSADRTPRGTAQDRSTSHPPEPAPAGLRTTRSNTRRSGARSSRRPFPPFPRGFPRTALHALFAALALTVSATWGTTTAAVAQDNTRTSRTPVQLDLPKPSGPHPVGGVSLHLTDEHRADPWKPDRARELMVNVRYPARATQDHPREPWVDEGIVPDLEEQGEELGIPPGSVDYTSLRTHAHHGAPVDRRGGPLPVVLYSPGLGSYRAMGSLLVDELASRGYLVLSMDHTYETAVAFPDGRVTEADPRATAAAGRKTAIDARVADTRFLLDRLTALDHGATPAHGLPGGLAGAVDLDHVGVFGHSYGGYTAGEALFHDRRLDAGINLDGTLAHSSSPAEEDYRPGEVTRHGLARPFLLMGADGPEPGSPAHTHRSTADRSWPDFWDHQHAWKRDLLLHNSAHHSYSDFQLLLPQVADGLGLPAGNIRQLVGDVDPAASLAAQRHYVTSFFDLHLRGRDTGAFEAPSPRYPEVEFVT